MAVLKFKTEAEYEKWVTDNKLEKSVKKAEKKADKPKKKLTVLYKYGVKKVKSGIKSLPEPYEIDSIGRTGVKTLQQGLSFAKGTPKNTVGHITRSTSTMRGTRGEYSRNGLRSEWTSRGPVNKDKMPILDEHWSTHTEARGELNIGGKPKVKGSLTRPSPTFNTMAPSFDFTANVKMPKVRRIKGRKP